jgi:hypothetical protein
MCSAQKCTKWLSHNMFMCRHHWSLVPYKMQSAIWKAYVPGQRAGSLSEEYRQAASRAIIYVADLEKEREKR